MNKIAMITGATSGIGLGTAKALASEGFNLILTGRRNDRLENIKKEIEEKYKVKVLILCFDVRNQSEVEKAVSSLSAEWKNIDVLVNNAGIGGGDISCTTEEEFDQVIQTNLKGTFFLSRVIARYMIENKIKGNILNIASSSSLRPAASAYTFSKWGIRGFTLGLAKTLAPYGITVNGLAPGPTATPMLKRDANDITFTNNPMGRFAMPEEIANMAVILVSDMGRSIMGDIVYMTGGAGILTYDDVNYGF